MAPAKKRATRSANARMGSIMPPVDVNNAKLVGELKKRIAKGPITLIFVYADWCGHCQAYKSKFAELENNKNRSIQIARVRDDVYPSLGIENGEIEAYPSVIAVSRAHKALNFKDGEGNGSNTVPDHTNMKMMNSIVENGLPESATGAKQETSSMNVSRPLNSQMNNNIENAIQNMPPSTNGNMIPPDTSNDSIEESKNRTKEKNSLFYKAPAPVMNGGNCGCGGGPKSLLSGLSGGSGGLYGLLTSVASEAAAPALLLGTAAYLTTSRTKRDSRTKRGSKSKKTRKVTKTSKKRSTRRV